MNILFGHYVADAGTVEVFGRPLPPGSLAPQSPPASAWCTSTSRWPTTLLCLTTSSRYRAAVAPELTARRRARERLRDFRRASGSTVDPDARVSKLSVGERQRVEILKALYRDARILILDEPTAVLTPQESAALFATLRRMADGAYRSSSSATSSTRCCASSDRIVVLRAGADRC